MNTPNIAMPGETVIASAFFTDESVALMTLAPEAPYYRVHLNGQTSPFFNIIEAAELWQDLTQ